VLFVNKRGKFGKGLGSWKIEARSKSQDLPAPNPIGPSGGGVGIVDRDRGYKGSVLIRGY